MDKIHIHKWKRSNSPYPFYKCSCGARIVEHGFVNYYLSENVVKPKPVKSSIQRASDAVANIVRERAPALRDSPFVDSMVKMMLFFYLPKGLISERERVQLMTEGALAAVKAAMPNIEKKILEGRRGKK